MSSPLKVAWEPPRRSLANKVPSNVMRTIAATVKNRSREGSISPSQHTFERIGNLTFLQLSTLRHRGAFTTVSATFTTCCQQSKGIFSEGAENHLLRVWYEGTLKEILTQRSTTRRSAGIPSLMTGILCANAPDPSFEEAMEKLMEIAAMKSYVSDKEVTSLPQVHAFNCLKAIFKNSLLTSMGNKAERYLTKCLELAASALRSEVWAIRNCGLIFLRSLIDCLFGSTESKAVIEAGWDGKAHKIHYHRYSNLPEVLVKLLQSGQDMVASVNASAAESVFPALDIIRRAGPPEVLREELQSNIVKYLSSPVWHVREMAARTLCSCLLHDGWLVEMQKVVQGGLSDASVNRQNHMHGALLSLKIVIERKGELSPSNLLSKLSFSVGLVNENINMLIRTADTLQELTLWLNGQEILSRYHHCPEISAAYLEIVNSIWLFQLSQGQPIGDLTTKPLSTYQSALLKSQSAINEAISTSQDEKERFKTLRHLFIEDRTKIGGLVPAIEVLPRLWPISSPTSPLAELCQLYTEICQHVESTEVRVVALENLSQILDALLEREKQDSIPLAQLLDLWMTIPLRQMSPSLADAIIRASGSIMAAFLSGNSLSPETLKNWGQLVAEAGLDDRVSFFNPQ